MGDGKVHGFETGVSFAAGRAKKGVAQEFWNRQRDASFLRLPGVNDASCAERLRVGEGRASAGMMDGAARRRRIRLLAFAADLGTPWGPG